MVCCMVWYGRIFNMKVWYGMVRLHPYFSPSSIVQTLQKYIDVYVCIGQKSEKTTYRLVAFSLLQVPFEKDCILLPNPFQKMDCNPPPLQQNEKGLQSFLQSSLRSFRVPFKGIGETPEAT